MTTDHVLDETATLVRMATDVDAAVRTVEAIRGARSVTVVWIDPGHFDAAMDLFARHRDKRRSFTDCASFAVMKDLGIAKAFAFDRNFEEAGFTQFPRVPSPPASRVESQGRGARPTVATSSRTGRSRRARGTASTPPP